MQVTFVIKNVMTKNGMVIVTGIPNIIVRDVVSGLYDNIMIVHRNKNLAAYQ